MKLWLKVLLLLALAFSFLIPRSEVKAGDYVADAIEALKTSSVYVAPGTPGTDLDTPSRLATLLIPGDNVVLVMLPPEALAGTDLYTMARRISEGLGNQKTVGLAVGREVIGYSLILPEGVANDKMRRANTVSGDPVTALTIFTQNIHAWQAYNPQPTPTPVPTTVPTPRPTMEPIELPETNEVPVSLWGICIVVFFVLIIALAIRIKKVRDRSKYDSLMSEIRRDN